MAVPSTVRWPTCSVQEGCDGAQLASASGPSSSGPPDEVERPRGPLRRRRIRSSTQGSGTGCLAHAEDGQRDVALRRFTETGSLDARGVPISRRLGQQITAAAPVNEKGLRWFMNVDFTQATFEDNYAGFWGATFFGRAEFSGVRFKRDVDFSNAWFEYSAVFFNATFEDDVRYNFASFKSDANFRNANFQGSAEFVGARFEDFAIFDKATFQGLRGWPGLIRVEGLLSLDDTQFSGPVRIAAAASRLSCRRARFLGGARFDVRRAHILLDDADLSVPSLLTGSPPPVPPPPDDGHPLPPDDGQPPKLVSLQRANVAGLGLANVDLTNCRFAGAHNLDKLRLENVVFGFSPARAGWERRRVIAEESAWRYEEAHDNSAGNGTAPLHRVLRAGSLPPRRAMRALAGRWTEPAWGGWDENDGARNPKPGALKPGAIAGLYRALRKGREDLKDEPGAADFYYGEMEMRRHDREVTDDGDGSRGQATRSVHCP